MDIEMLSYVVYLIGRDELLLQIVLHFLLWDDELGGHLSTAPPRAVWSESSAEKEY